MSSSNNRHVGGDDNASIASSVLSRASKKKYRQQRINSELSEPLTANNSQVAFRDEELGNSDDSGDPFFVFRSDLVKKLELVDESIAEYLRVVHETVSFLS